MATVITTVLLRGLSGKMGDVVYVNRKGKVHVRKLVSQRNPDTPAQRAQRDNMKQVVSEWRAMDRDEKDSWGRLARKKDMSGYHFYVSRRMKELKKN